MTRRYDEWIAGLFDVIPGRMVLLALFLITLVGALAWYSFPHWLPRHWASHLPRLPRLRFRLPRLRFRFRRAAKGPAETQEIKIQKPPRVRDQAPTPEPDADVLAAQGRYGEAIRQRLRDTVADLTRAGVVTPEPGSTVVELAGATSANRPTAARAMDAATELFSQVWYGQGRAGAEHDERMRRLTDEVRSDLGGRP
jgi:hypothetical protein